MIGKLIHVLAALIFISCAAENKNFKMGTYGYDKDFFEKHNIETLELVSENNKARILVSPSYQGRVMTSSSAGESGDSYGWINYKLIESGKVNENFNPVGGEERFWLGPEGGPYSLYFKEGDEQVYENWIVPSIIDRERFEIVSQNNKSAEFKANCSITNAAGSELQMNIERKVSLLSNNEINKIFGINIDNSLNVVGYQTDNKITNIGDIAWTKEGGLVSIWLLGMFNPTETTTVFIPYNQDAEGVIVNDEYFGKIPAERLLTEEGILYFKIDGKYRSKLGIPKSRATELSGSYDSAKGVLTLVLCDVDKGEEPYLNGQWGEQTDPYAGDVINAYNDGPVEDGSIMGPFYEIETSSPGKELKRGESLSHQQATIHIQGDKDKLSIITLKLLGVTTDEISSKFNK